MDLFWWIQITAVCLYVFILLISVFSLLFIKKNLKTAREEKIQNIESLMEVYIEPLINGAMLAIVFLNIIPMLANQISTFFSLTNVEQSIFISNLLTFVFLSLFSLSSIAIQYCIHVTWQNDINTSNPTNICKSMMIIFSLGLHAFIEGFNIGIQKSLIPVIAFGILTAIHEAFLLPLIVLRTIPFYIEGILNKFELILMVLYTACCPIGMVIGSLLMNINSGHLYVFIALIIAAGVLLDSILTNTLLNGRSSSDRKENFKSVLLFNIGLLFIGFISYIKSI